MTKIQAPVAPAVAEAPMIAPTMVRDPKDVKRDWLNEVLHVEFYNLEEPGVNLTFVTGNTKKPEKHILFHGGKYKLRRETINHLQSRQTPIFSYRPNGQGQMEKALSGYKSRFQCRQIFE